MVWRPDNHRENTVPVIIKRDALADPSRGGRAVPFKLYLPENQGAPAPLIVWSHGLGGSRDGATFLARYLAECGYAVANIQHAGTDTSLWEGKPGHPWDVMRATPVPRAAALDRFRDVPFVLDALPAWHAAQGNLPPVDFGNAGISGHSFGALTTQVMAGQLYPDEHDVLRSFAEPRFRAGILYSPVPTLKYGPEVYAPITLPLLHMTGTVDDSPIETFGYRERLAVYEHSGAREKALLILKDGDHMIFTGSRGQLGGSANRAPQEEQIRVIAHAWWDAHLKNSGEARSWLSGAGAKEFLGGLNEFTSNISG